MSDPEIVMSPLCQEISKDGTSVQVDSFVARMKLAGYWRS